MVITTVSRRDYSLLLAKACQDIELGEITGYCTCLEVLCGLVLITDSYMWQVPLLVTAKSRDE